MSSLADTSQIGFYGKLVVDTAALEAWAAEVSRLTGAPFEGTVDYYLCRDSNQAFQLTGERHRRWASYRRCCISMKAYDLQEIAYAMTKGLAHPLDPVWIGAAVYGEFKRCRTWPDPSCPGTAECRIGATVLRDLDQFGNSPLTTLLAQRLDTLPRRRRDAALGVIGAFAEYLIATHGPERYCLLYQQAHSAAAFPAVFQSVYGISLDSAQAALLVKYEPFAPQAGS